MIGSEMVLEITDYFAGRYSDKQTEKMTEICDNIPDESRKLITEALIEDNPPNFKVGVSAIIEACRKHGVPFRETRHEYIPATDWQCDCCRMQFKAVKVASYEDKHDRGLHDKCPRCGLAPYDTEMAQAYAARHDGKNPKWYGVLISDLRKAYEKRGGWIFDKAKDDAFDAKRDREKVEAMKRDVQEEVARVAKAKGGS